MQELTGSFGKFALIQGQRILDINLETTTQFFQQIAIKKTDVVGNALNLYSFLPVGRWGKAKMTSMSVPKNLLQSRKNCKTWTPKGRMYLKPDEIDTAPIEYMGEQCSDGLIGDCLEYVLGVGNAVRDITATAEGQRIWAQAINNLFLGLGNSFYDLLSFGQNPLITDADNNDWWNKDTQTDAEWADYKDQQLGIAVKGHMTLVEEVKAAGAAHFNVTIPGGDISGPDYTGSDVTTLFDAVDKAATSKLKILLKQRNMKSPKVVRLVTRSIFDAYYNYLIATYVNLPESLQMLINGEAVPGVLFYKGVPVVCMDEWSEFDEQVGVNTHRVLLTAVGNMAVAHDIPALEQFNGIGMRIEQSTRLKDKGITYMNTNFRLGTGIADTDFMVNASEILTP